MSKDMNSTRRSFLKSGAILAAPLAAAPAAVLGDDGWKARLARLEDEAAIRKLHQGWLRQVNAGAGDAPRPLFADPEGTAFGERVHSIAADHSGEPDTIEVSPDGKSAAGRFPCAVEIQTTIPQDCTLARMAHAQGGGFVRRTERRLLKVEYVKACDTWTIAKVEFAWV